MKNKVSHIMSIRINSINLYNNNRVLNFKGNHDNSMCHFEEDLEKKYVLDGFLAGHNEIEGTINGTPVYLREEESKEGSEKSTKYKGTIGGDYVDIEIKNKNIKGEIGGREIILSFDKNDYGEYFLRGVIGKKPICIANNASIEEAQGEEDIITTVVSLLGHKLTVKDGNFSTIGFSKQAKKEKTSQALSDWQIQQQNQMLAQSMIITKQIMENSDIFKEEDEEENTEEKPEELKEPDENQNNDSSEDLFNLIYRM